MSPQGPSQRIRVHYAWVIAFVGCLVLALAAGFGNLAYSIILPSMRSGLSLTYAQAGFISTVSGAGHILLTLVGGAIAVRFGFRRTIPVALGIMGVSMFVTGLADSFTTALLARLVTGMSDAAAVIPALALTTAWFARRRRGLAAGIVAAGLGVGGFFAGVFLPVVINGFGRDGWRYAWFLLGIIVCAAALVCYALIRDNPADKGLEMYGGIEAQNTASGVTLRTAYRDIHTNRRVRHLGLVYFTYGFSANIYTTFLVVYLINEVGFAAQPAAGVFALLGLATIVSGVLCGSLSDRIGRGYGLALTFGTLALSCLIIASWQSTAGARVSAILFGLTMASLPAIGTAAIGDAVGGRLAPAAVGGLTLVVGIGHMIGPAVAGWLRDLTGTFVGAFLLAASVLVLGAVSELVREITTKEST
jgi:MFS family permease